MLSVAAALLGHAPVLGVDIEAPSIEATRENAARNGVELDARLVDARRGYPATTSAVANISVEAVRALPGPQSTPNCSSRPATSSRSDSTCPVMRTSTGVRTTGGPRTCTGAPDPSRLSRVATFRVDFLGCKVSHVDAHDVREALLRRRARRAATTAADVAVISTCCVTNEALAKSRKAAARAARTHAGSTSPAAVRTSEATRSRACRRTSSSSRKRSEETAAFVAGDVGAIGCVQADARLDRVRAFVKIQDGCSFSCNFCVIPLVRGGSRSRSAAAVLGEIERRVAQGHREVVLTGINLGCFRDRADGYDLPRLVREAGATPGLERLRLSSIEINHVDAALIAALRETPTVSRHLHVPLQSGDDGVLRAMGRRYTTATYLRRLAPLAA